MAADPLVVVQEVAAAVEDRAPAVDLDRHRVVRGVAVDDVDGRALHQRVREAPVSGGNVVPPVGAPVHRRHDDVARAPRALHEPGHALDGLVGEVRQQVDARRRRARRPVARNAGVRGAEGEDERAAPAAEIERRRRPRRGQVAARARHGNAGARERLHRLDQPRPSPVEHVVVRQHAAVDVRRREHRHVLRVHAVVDLLGHGVVARGDARLQVDDARVRPLPREHLERRPPHVAVLRGPRDRAVGLLGEGDVVERGGDVRLVQPRPGGAGEDLVHAAPRHHVPAEEERDAAPHAQNATIPNSGSTPRYTCPTVSNRLSQRKPWWRTVWTSRKWRSRRLRV